MCLVKVNRIYRDSRLLRWGVICGEDDNMFTNSLTHLHEQFDLFRFSCSEMFGLSTVNMKNICVVDVLHVLTAKVVLQEEYEGATTTMKWGTLMENLHASMIAISVYHHQWGQSPDRCIFDGVSSPRC